MWPLHPCTSTEQEGTGLFSCVPGGKLRVSEVAALRLFGDCNVAASTRSQTQLGLRKDFLIVQTAQTGYPGLQSRELPNSGALSIIMVTHLNNSFTDQVLTTPAECLALHTQQLTEFSKQPYEVGAARIL